MPPFRLLRSVTSPARRLRAALVLAAVASLAGCGGCGRAIDPPGPPPLPPTADAPAPVLSSLVLPVAIPADEIGELVDEVIPQRLYATEGRPLRRGVVRARLDLVVRRRGAVRIDTREGQLVTHLPLRAEGRLRLVRGVSRPFETTFTVHAVTDLTL
ncbi:MAG: DUF4403 family protein, partial [Rhodothermales bacterium]|nr:DUF4403 family protein [Rhodothermales bacterium]